VKKAAVKKPANLSPRGPEKKGIYQARSTRLDEKLGLTDSGVLFRGRYHRYLSFEYYRGLRNATSVTKGR
jgi:hypothetical protein